MSVGQPSAPNEISKLHSVSTTDARSRFGAEVKMTDASNSGVQLASDDATDSIKRSARCASVVDTSRSPQQDQSDRSDQSDPSDHHPDCLTEAATCGRN